MKQHIKELDLALYASGDLRPWERLTVHAHVRRCEGCRAQVEQFRADARTLRDASKEFPEGVDWARLSAEMAANIHVGLAAGECVSPRTKGKPARTSVGDWVPERWRPLALASCVTALMAVLLVGGWWLNVPPQDTQSLNRAMKSVWRGRTAAAEERGPVIEASTDGIDLRKDGGSLGVGQDSAQLVTVSVSTQGSASAHYVDQDTGQVTITSVYAQ
jgi:anti-sigma factor ChrR (cupin superfamily)